jgi:hypothetical protein
VMSIRNTSQDSSSEQIVVRCDDEEEMMRWTQLLISESIRCRLNAKATAAAATSQPTRQDLTTGALAFF